jgi:hypothetical protein
VTVTAEDLEIKIAGIKLWKAVKGDRYPHTEGKSARKMDQTTKAMQGKGERTV